MFFEAFSSCRMFLSILFLLVEGHPRSFTLEVFSSNALLNLGCIFLKWNLTKVIGMGSDDFYYLFLVRWPCWTFLNMFSWWVLTSVSFFKGDKTGKTAFWEPSRESGLLSISIYDTDFWFFCFEYCPFPSIMSECPSPKTPLFDLLHWMKPLCSWARRREVSSSGKRGEDSGMEPWGAQVYLLNCLSTNLIFGTPLSFLVTSRVTWHLPSPETFWDFVGKLVFLLFWFVAGLAISSRKLPKSGHYPSFCFLGF